MLNPKFALLETTNPGAGRLPSHHVGGKDLTEDGGTGKSVPPSGGNGVEEHIYLKEGHYKKC